MAFLETIRLRLHEFILCIFTPSLLSIFAFISHSFLARDLWNQFFSPVLAGRYTLLWYADLNGRNRKVTQNYACWRGVYMFQKQNLYDQVHVKYIFFLFYSSRFLHKYTTSIVLNP